MKKKKFAKFVSIFLQSAMKDFNEKVGLIFRNNTLENLVLDYEICQNQIKFRICLLDFGYFYEINDEVKKNALYTDYFENKIENYTDPNIYKKFLLYD